MSNLTDSNTPWWASKWGRDKICSITHVRLRPGKKITTLKCGHAFYKSAISSWLKTNDTCPLCRQCVKPKRYVSSSDEDEIWI